MFINKTFCFIVTFLFKQTEGSRECIQENPDYHWNKLPPVFYNSLFRLIFKRVACLNKGTCSIQNYWWMFDPMVIELKIQDTNNLRLHYLHSSNNFTITFHHVDIGSYSYNTEVSVTNNYILTDFEFSYATQLLLISPNCASERSMEMATDIYIVSAFFPPTRTSRFR